MFYRPRKKAKKIGDVLEEGFIKDMGPGLKRGMVLKVYKAKIKEATGGRTGFAEDISSARLLPEDPEASDFGNPTLVVHFKSGSHWVTELYYQREQIKELINERLEDEFLKEVRFK